MSKRDIELFFVAETDLSEGLQAIYLKMSLTLCQDKTDYLEKINIFQRKKI